MDKLVSIIIPCYNYGFVLAETLNSVQNQTYKHWEALVIDDGSTDDTREIVEHFIKKDKRFRLFSQQNLGVSTARNLGLEMAKGEFIQFLDADDILSPEKISLQVELMEANKGVDICYCLTQYFNHLIPDVFLKSSELPFPIVVPDLSGRGPRVIKELLVASVTICSPLLRSGITKSIRFDKNMKHVEDWHFWLMCALNNASFYYLDNTLANVKIRIHEHSVSQDKLSMQKGEAILREKIIALLKDNKLFSAKEKRELLKVNRVRKVKVYKYILSSLPVSDFSELRKLYQEAGFGIFLLSFIKALNRKRMQC